MLTLLSQKPKKVSVKCNNSMFDSASNERSLVMKNGGANICEQETYTGIFTETRYD